MGLAASEHVLNSKTFSTKCTDQCSVYPSINILPCSPIRKLELQGNRIQYLPPDLRWLQYLDLSYNHYSEIDIKIISALRTYTSLKILKLNNNEIKQYSEDLANALDLDTLDLTENSFVDWNMNIEKLENLSLARNFLTNISVIPMNLISLDISFNRLTSFTGSSVNLKVLNISGNNIEKLPNLEFVGLEKLFVSHNLLNDINNLKSFSPNLEVLDASYNCISIIPNELPDNISSFNLSHNSITDIPDSFYSYNITKLLMNGNKIKKVNHMNNDYIALLLSDNEIEEIGQITKANFSELILTNNKIVTIPDISLVSISVLNMSCNCLSDVKLEHISNSITNIDLSSNNFNIFPISIFKLHQLKVLNLNNNNIGEIPDEIIETNLSSLSISINPIKKLSKLPSSLFSFSACDCELENIDNISACPSIQEIRVNGNMLKKFPSIPTAKIISASRNQISRIPVLSSATHIDFSHNIITSVNFLFSRNLKQVDLSHNKISTLDLSPCKSLLKLNVAHNPLTITLSLYDLEGLTSIDITGITKLNIKSDPNKNSSFEDFITSDPENIEDATNISYKLFNTEKAGYSDMQGKRDSMEDSLIIRRNISENLHLFGICDGHGGKYCSHFSTTALPFFFSQLPNTSEVNLLNSLKFTVDTLRKKGVTDGTTITIVLFDTHLNRLICANVGDTRALLIKKDGSFVEMTHDHKPFERSELVRIRDNCRSFVRRGRTAGRLAVSRAIGDFNVKGVSSNPQIYQCALTDNDFRILLGCDGVFDVVSNEKAAELCFKSQSPELAAAKIRDVSYELGSTDNISVVCANIF